MKHFTKFYYFSSLLICLLFAAQSSYADGSKDLYPGGNGGRAKLRSSTASSASYPFASLNTHYVYVKAGETITMASSVMGLGNARIKLTKPDGTTTSYSGATGFISNRINELAGPRLPGVSGGNYYDAILYPVPVGGGWNLQCRFCSASRGDGYEYQWKGKQWCFGNRKLESCGQY